MKFKSIFSFFSIIVLFQLFPLIFTSCIDDCSGQARFYRLSGFNGEVREYVPTNPGWQTRPWSNTINLTTEKLLLWFIFEEENLDKKDFVRRADTGLPILYACDPAVNLEAGVEKIELFADKDFNSNFPAGTDLSEMLLIAIVGGSEFSPLMTRRDSNRNVYNFTNFAVRFNQESEQTEAMKFTCNVTLQDGREFSSTIENIILRVN
ncbi:hypothetical protein [Aquiflexum sp.]|uniref:hypothetical protein n=1 Tax=Aquiflexum sp. TaxID=1872584 RepID=UPI0035940B22